MDETKNLWNKKMDELTVRDVVVMNLIVPAVMVGGVVVIGTVVNVGTKTKDKFQEILIARQIKKLEKQEN
jgi:hypothetical protein